MQSVTSPTPRDTGVRVAAGLAGILALLAMAPAAPLRASERAEVPLVCPLDGAEFKAMQDLSGYAEGQRLDLMKLGPITQPWALARCPECGYPLFRKHPDPQETARLKAAVAGARFQTEGRNGTPYFALGVLLEELPAPAFEVGWAYLQASWEAEDRGPEDYARAATRACQWFDRAAVEGRDQPARRREWCIARYLPVELDRRMGRFPEARQRLAALGALTHEDLPWLPAALAAQDRLISAQDSRPDNGRTDLPPPPPEPRPDR